jgi:hypothetical protein
VAAEHPQRFGALRIVVQKDVALLAFDQSEDIDVIVHDWVSMIAPWRGFVTASAPSWRVKR